VIAVSEWVWIVETIRRPPPQECFLLEYPFGFSLWTLFANAGGLGVVLWHLFVRDDLWSDEAKENIPGYAPKRKRP
jgi:hypothetical protein